MTRTQGLKVADCIVKLAREAAPNPEWTEINFPIPSDVQARLDENLGLIVGCLPMGWRLDGDMGSPRLTVRRNL